MEYCSMARKKLDCPKEWRNWCVPWHVWWKSSWISLFHNTVSRTSKETNWWLKRNIMKTDNIFFPNQILDLECHSPVLLELFFLLVLVLVLKWLSLVWEALIILFSWFPLTFLQTQKGMPLLIVQLMVILMLTGTIFVIIWEIWEDILKVSGSAAAEIFDWVQVRTDIIGIRLELINIRSSLTYLHDFLLFVLLPLLFEIPFFVCANQMKLLNLK